MQESPLALKLNTSAAQLHSGSRPPWHRVCRLAGLFHNPECNLSWTSHCLLVQMLSNKLRSQFYCSLLILGVLYVQNWLAMVSNLFKCSYNYLNYDMFSGIIHTRAKKVPVGNTAAWKWINNTDKAWGCKPHINSPDMTRFTFKANHQLGSQMSGYVCSQICTNINVCLHMCPCAFQNCGCQHSWCRRHNGARTKRREPRT